MADLPLARVEDIAPFHHTGMDAFGHFVVSDGRATRRSSGSKNIWAILFTCMASRAVYLDVLHGLDT